jgi:hypothetical protein
LEDYSKRGIQAETPQKYDDKAYILAKANTKYNDDGSAVIEAGDEWLDETEWDDVYKQKDLKNAVSFYKKLES